jgi:glycosyltransferase involved in cell wall biosynthesis
MRALVVSNMRPDPVHPERGRFVRDQVRALQAIDGVEVELWEFPPGPAELLRAGRELRRRFGGHGRLDVVHAHFGLTAWPALAVPARVRALTVHGTDVRHPRTRLATRAVLPLIDLLAAPSAALAGELPARAARRALVLPTGVDVERFRPLARADARERLGLPSDIRYALFPADPARPEKRHDRALAVARAAGAELLVLGGVEPEAVPLWVNVADAVLVPSEREGFGLAAVEALACDVPVLATPVGIHPEALAGIEGTLCAPFDPTVWTAALADVLRDPDPRVAGRSAAEAWSVARMAARLAEAWQGALRRSAGTGG